ncbi:putative aminodeoxychorismate lyase [Dirofilaria immitis]
MLKVSEVTNDRLTLVHVVHRIELNRINDVNVQLKTVDLLEKAVNAHLLLLDQQIRNRIGVQQMAARKTMPNQSNQRKKSEKHENGSVSELSKRRRTRPTGLNFDD